jgi:hypothetical protein
MRIFAYFVIGLALGAAFQACSPANSTAPASSSAVDYFFQPNQAQIYTYSKGNATTVDTSSYKPSFVNPGDPYNSYLQLKNNQSTSPNDVLYYFKSEQSSDGSVVCLLANSPGTSGFIALKGSLDLGATWYADSSQNTQAVVVGRYAEYYLPGREVHYSDVVVVKYTDKTAPAGYYVVRYFARNYGLIFELTVTGSNTQVADLQLLSLQGSSSGANPDPHHDRWYDANGRSSVHMKQDDEFDR